MPRKPRPIFEVQTVEAKYKSHNDGDTVVVRDGFMAVVRIARIDAPEVPYTAAQRKAKSKIALCQYKWGKVAKDAIAQKINAVGNILTFEVVGFDNRYNRNIALARFADGVEWGSFLVEQGLALVYDKYAALGVDFGNLKQLEAQAKEQHLGVWSDPADFLEPWEFRKLADLAQAAEAPH